MHNTMSNPRANKIVVVKPGRMAVYDHYQKRDITLPLVSGESYMTGSLDKKRLAIARTTSELFYVDRAELMRNFKNGCLAVTTDFLNDTIDAKRTKQLALSGTGGGCSAVCMLAILGMGLCIMSK